MSKLCICNLRQLGRNNHVTRQWVAGHQETETNKKADKVAKKQKEIYYGLFSKYMNCYLHILQLVLLILDFIVFICVISVSK